MLTHGKTQHRNRDQDRDCEQQRVREKACLPKMRKGWGKGILSRRPRTYFRNSITGEVTSYQGIFDPGACVLILRWRPFGRAFVVSGSALRVGEVVVREKVKVVGFCQPERSFPTHGPQQNGKYRL
jgi:hypothetical protein